MTEKCNKQGCDKRSGKKKKCAVCGNFYHNACGEFSSYKDKAKPNEMVHLCSACNAIPTNSASLTLRYSSRSNSASSQSSKRFRNASDVSEESSDDEEEPDLKTILKAVKTGNAKTNNSVTELKKTVETFNANLNTRCDGIDNRISSLETELTELKKSHAAEMDALTEKYDELDFKTKTEVFIHGYVNAGAADLDLTAAVIHLAEHLDIKIMDREIQRARVVRRRTDQAPRSFAAAVQEKPPIIAVDFFTHETALRLVEAKKSYGKLKNSDLLQTNDTSPISISFPLNSEKYALLRETKARAAIHNTKYVWNSRGFVFIRQTDGARAIKVKNASHLDVLLPVPSTSPQQAQTQMDTTGPV